MRNIPELLDDLAARNVELWFEGDTLRYRAPKGVLTKENLQFLSEFKNEVLLLLRDRARKSISIAPVSYGQRALLFQSQMAPNSHSYNIPFVARVVSQINIDQLNRVFQKLIDRHPMLRTTYQIEDGIPAMRIAGIQEPVIVQHWVKDLTEEELFELVYDKNREPIDLENGPLIRTQVFSKSEIDHILLVTIHHIACDGWSLGIVLRDLKVFCEAEAGERGAADLQPLNYKYTDFVMHESQAVGRDEGEPLFDYWKGKLSGDLPIINLPFDYIRPASGNFDGSTFPFSVEKELYRALSSLAKNESVTLYSVLLSAFQVLLMRYSGQEDILVGTPALGRNKKEHENVVGLFINQVVMRGDLSGNPTFSQFLKKNNRTVLEALKHQDYPFPFLVEKLQPPRVAGCHPIFQVLFNLVKQTTISSIDRLLDGTGYDEPLPFGFLKLKPYPIPQQEGQFDLALEMLDNGHELFCSFRFRTDIFDQKTVAQMAYSYKRLIKSLVYHPNQSLWELQTYDEKGFLPIPSEALNSQWLCAVHERFSFQALKNARKVTVIDGTGSWEYADFERLSNQIANWLLADGVAKGDIVAVYGHRSAGLVLSLLGILKAGAAFLILDPAYPAARLVKMMQAAQPSGLLLLEAAGDFGEELSWIIEGVKFKCRLTVPQSREALEGFLSGLPLTAPGVSVGPEDTAYLIFTSGTTGEPKGIIGTHKPLSHFIDWHTRTFGLNESDRFSMLSGLSHDPLLRDIFTPLWVGGTLCIPELEEMLIPERFRQWMREQGVTVAHMTPALNQVLTEGWSGINGGEEGLSALHHIFFGGDVLTGQHVEMVRRVVPTVQCVNFYGTTETPQAMGYHVANANEGDEFGRRIPLGRGIEGAQLLILNVAGRLAGVGELGEIHVRTPYLSRGYLNDGDLTHARYVQNPHTGAAEDILYRTGDLGRYLLDGAVMFYGRADSQVSIRGFRVELGEIEASIKELNGVSNCAVILWEDARGCSGWSHTMS